MIRQKPQDFRDGVLFFAGLAGMFYEVVIKHPPDFGFVPFLMAMMGAPAFLRRDANGSGSDDDDGNDGKSGPTDNALGD